MRWGGGLTGVSMPAASAMELRVDRDGARALVGGMRPLPNTLRREPKLIGGTTGPLGDNSSG